MDPFRRDCQRGLMRTKLPKGLRGSHRHLRCFVVCQVFPCSKQKYMFHGPSSRWHFARLLRDLTWDLLRPRCIGASRDAIERQGLRPEEQVSLPTELT